MSYKLIRRFSTIHKQDSLLFFGSSTVAFPSLKAIAPHFPNLQVITHFSDPNRKLTNQVQIYCQQSSTPFKTPIKQHKDRQKRAKQWDDFSSSLLARPKFGIICSYGFMIPNRIIDLFEMGLIVVHPSLLPKYRGGAPIFHAMANGDKESGVSYIQISKDKFDQGNLLYQAKTQISQTATYEEVQHQLAGVAGKNLMFVLQNIDELRPGIPQSKIDPDVPEKLRLAPIIKEKKLDLSLKAEEVYNWSRALKTPRVIFDGKEVMVYFDRQFEEDENGQYGPGDIVMKGKRVYVKCGDKLLRVRGWQEPTKAYQKIHRFVNRFNPDKSRRLSFE